MNRFLLWLVLSLSFFVKAQMTVRGIVIDAQKEPLPFVDVFVKGHTKYGTSTDGTGNFVLTIGKEIKNVYLSFSYVGFHTKTVRVNPRTGFLKIKLKEESSALDEVIVVTKPKKRLKKKENPAYPILREVWKHKRKNGLDFADGYTYKKHVITQIGLNNVDSTLYKSVNKLKKKASDFEIPYDEQGRPYLPFYIEEKKYDVYGRSNPKISKENLTAERRNGMAEKSFIFDRLSNVLNRPINIYKNHIMLLRKSFVSPIASSGFQTYDYVLYDTVKDNGRDQYRIFFFPRQNADLAFEGNVLIDSESYVVSKIRMKTHKDINMNYVRSLELEKEYYIENDSIFYAKSFSYKVDFTLISKNENNRGMLIERATHFKDYKIGRPKEVAFYQDKVIKYRPDQFKKTNAYWQTDKISQARKDIYKTVDDFKANKKIKRLSSFFNIIASGYFDVTNNWQVGPFWLMIQENQIEGYKINLPFRSFKTLDDRFRFKPFIAYGTLDKKFKYGASALYLLSYKPRIEASVGYSKNIVNFSQSTDISQLLPNAFYSQNLFNRGENFTFHWEEKYKAGLNFRLAKNLRFAINARRRKMRSASPEKFSINYRLNGKIFNSFTDTHSEYTLIFTPRRFVYGLGVEQRMGKNLYPALIFNYRIGHKGLLGGDFDYHKLQFAYKHPLTLGAIGLLDIIVEAGKIYGTLPLSLLNTVPANQRLTMQPATFALMNYYDFITDTYVFGHFEHHFNGFVFNRIPLLKKINLRLVSSFRFAYGAISEANKAINLSDISYQAPEKPYYEYSVGIENIGYKNIRILRFDAIWRSNYTSKLSVAPTPKFAIRLKIKPNF